MTEEKKQDKPGATAITVSGGRDLTCVRCLGMIPAGEEFCPHCKCPALWSQPEFLEKRKINAAEAKAEAVYTKMAADWGEHPYQEQSMASEPQPVKKQRDFTKPLLILAVLIAIGLGIYYVYDKQNNQPTPAEAQAIQMVKDSYILDAEETVEQVLTRLAQSSFEVQRVIGWKAQQLEGSIYLVAFLYDNDLYGGNGTRQYLFEADLEKHTVKAADETMLQKYKDLGLIAP